MNIFILPALMIGICLVVGLRHRAGRVGEDAEFTHAAQLGRRLLLAGAEAVDRRGEPRHDLESSGVASVLGCEESRTNCRILNASRSGMRIAVERPLTADGQINVEWGSDYFVGTIRYVHRKGEQQILGLSVVSTNRGYPLSLKDRTVS